MSTEDNGREWLSELPPMAGARGKNAALLAELRAHPGLWCVTDMRYGNAGMFARMHGLECAQRQGVVYLRAREES